MYSSKCYGLCGRFAPAISFPFRPPEGDAKMHPRQEYHQFRTCILAQKLLRRWQLPIFISSSINPPRMQRVIWFINGKMFQAAHGRIRRGLEVRYWRQSRSQHVRRASVFKAVIGDVLLIFGIAVVAFYFAGYLILSVKSGESTFPIKQGPHGTYRGMRLQ